MIYWKEFPISKNFPVMNEWHNEQKPVKHNKEYKFDKPLIHKINSIIDHCIRDCHIKYFHTFKYKCVYDNNFTSIANHEVITITIADIEMNRYGLSKKFNFARQKVLYLIKQVK